MNNMKAKKMNLITGCLASFAVLSTGTLFADDHMSKKHDKGKDMDHSSHTAMTARSIEGMDFNYENGNVAGVIDDFVISTDSNEVEGLVVGTGFLGLGGPEHYVAIDKVSDRTVRTTNLNTELTEKELTDQPIFLRDRLETERDNKTNIRTGEFVAMDLVGSDVYSKDGSFHGEVHDWIVDIQSGDVPYVIVRRLEPATSVTSNGYDYFAVSTDTLVGVRSNDLIVSASNDAFTSAEYIDDSTLLREASDSSVRTFRYDAGGA